MVDAAKTLFPEEDFYALIGGFHLFKKEASEVKTVLEQLQHHGFARILPLHCSGDNARELASIRLNTVKPIEL
jgi:metal-dependent hydrolase (beta-lactamase superfamily II)